MTILNHVPTPKNYALVVKCYKKALNEWGRALKKDYVAEIIEHYFTDKTDLEKQVLRNLYHSFLSGNSFKNAYIEPFSFMAKAQEFYTLKTGLEKPADFPETEPFKIIDTD